MFYLLHTFVQLEIALSASHQHTVRKPQWNTQPFDTWNQLVNQTEAQLFMMRLTIKIQP